MSQRVEWVASPPVAWAPLVSDGSAPSIITTTLAAGTVGSSASQTISAVGTAPLVFSLASGSLPLGRSLSSAGELTGTYTTAGAFSFSVQVANGFGTATQGFTQSVAAAGTLPTVVTSSLPFGTVGSAYSQTVTATGSATITWSIVSGSLPVGLTLNASTGAITGTPTAAEISQFTLRATNAYGVDDQVLSISVVAVAQTQVASPWARWIQR